MALHIGLARPVLPAPRLRAEQRLFEITPHRQTLAQLRRGRGIESEAVVAQPVAPHAFELGEMRGRQPLRLIQVAQFTIAQDPFPLREHPMAPDSVIAAVQGHARHMKHALSIPHQFKVQSIQGDLTEGALQCRGGGQGQGDSTQRELCLSRCIEDADIADLKRWNPTA